MHLQSFEDEQLKKNKKYTSNNSTQYNSSTLLIFYSNNDINSDEINTYTKFDNNNITSHLEKMLLRDVKKSTHYYSTDHQNGNNNTKIRKQINDRKSNYQTTVDKKKTEPTNFNNHKSYIFIFGDSIVKSVNCFKLTGKVAYKCIINVCQFSGTKTSCKKDYIKPIIKLIPLKIEINDLHS